MKMLASYLLSVLLGFCLAGCDGSPGGGGAQGGGTTVPTGGASGGAGDGGGGHAHAEDDLGTAMIGDLEVQLAQGHGAVEAGKEGHLVVKLPYSDNGATIVRAWIGTEDRTLSLVGKGTYAPSHDDYDVHATAPDPLPDNVMWWIEVQKPDGTKSVGSAKPLM